MKKNLTIPNLLSLFRLLLVPAIAVLYLDSRIDGHLIWAAGFIVLSGATDVADGWIARRFHMTSALGQILDPLADKLTQATVLICLCIRHPMLAVLTGLVVIKEACMLIGALVLRTKENIHPPSARWWGKLSTVVIFATMVATVLWDSFPWIPALLPECLMLCAIGTTVLSFVAYYLRIYRVLRHSTGEPNP